jgi:hypothetical protein
MTTFRTITFGLLLSIVGASAALAQTDVAVKRPAPDDANVTISITARGVRFSAPGSVGQVRLEVFDSNGASVYNSEFQPGNVRDWTPQDKQGQSLADGSYLCVVTLRGVSKRMSVRQGTVVIQGGQASLQLSEGEQVGAVESEKNLSQVATTDAASAGTLLAHDGKVGQVVSTSGGLAFRVGDFFGGNDKELMRLTSEGNLGVGTTQPRAKLDVAGTLRARGGILFDDGTVLTTTGAAARLSPGGEVVPAVSGTGTPNRVTKWADASGTLTDSALFESGGQLGVGTTSPNANAVLHADRAQGVGTAIFVTNSSGGNTSLASIRAGLNPSNYEVDYTSVNILGPGWQAGLGGAFLKGRTGLIESSGSNFGIGNTNNTEPIIFYMTSSRIERMRLTSAGDLGLGTESPAAKLDVVGDIRVSGNAVINGNIAAKYQDVAEWVPARQKIAAGTVVILDTTRTNGVAPSARSYDTHVAGVVSAQPGVILGQGGEGQVLVATTGRVKVRVDATRHAIKIGDLLVTSDTPGSAMKSLPIRVAGNRLHRPGTIIGKALEPLAGGKGEILVLLSLQ